MKHTKSEQLFEQSKSCIPGGVNSPVRAYQAVGSSPVFLERAKGSKIYDVDGQEYIDYVCSFGPCILGHCDNGVISAVKQACHKGLTFGAPTEAEYQVRECAYGIYRCYRCAFGVRHLLWYFITTVPK